MKDTMTKEERLQAVFRLRIPDRVPVVPLLGYFLSQYSGITSAELWSDEKKRMFAWDKFYDELGPVDAIYHDNSSEPLSQLWTIPMKTLWPGKELPPDALTYGTRLKVKPVLERLNALRARMLTTAIHS